MEGHRWRHTGNEKQKVAHRGGRCTLKVAPSSQIKEAGGLLPFLIMIVFTCTKVKHRDGPRHAFRCVVAGKTGTRSGRRRLFSPTSRKKTNDARYSLSSGRQDRSECREQTFHPRSCTVMTTTTMRTIRRAEGTDEIWTAAATLFSEHYGVWGSDSERQGMAFPPQAFSTFLQLYPYKAVSEDE